MTRKVRAISKSQNDTDKILEQHSNGLKPSQIYKHFSGKYTYWQIYNTISPRDAKSSKQIDEEENITDKKIKADKTVTEMPDVDLSDFISIEKFIEHQLTVVIAQLNDKKLTLEKRTFLIKSITEINKKLKAQLLENHLKNANARLIICIMRRLQPEISDEEIMKIFKEESEKMKKLNK